MDAYHTGTYAGYFNGDVRVTGTLLAANIISPAATSYSSGNNLIMCYGEQPIHEKLSQIDLLEIQTKNKKSNSASATNKFVLPEGLEEIQDCYPDDLQMTEAEQEAEYDMPQPDKRYSLAADQLKEAFPELVYEDKDGNVSINYVEMVPLLVKSINELTAKIHALEKANNDAQSVYSNVRV